MTARVRWFVGFLFVGLLAVAGFRLIASGLYGLSLFVMLPVCLGGLSAAWLGSSTAWKAVKAGVIANFIATLALFALGKEGAICIVMALPLVLPLGGLGGWLAYHASPLRATASNVSVLLILPLATLGWDTHAQPPVFEVRSSIEIAATPEQVWKHVVTFSELPEPTEWYFNAGLAYPKRARIEGSGPGAVRYCEFSTGPFVEPIEVWNAPRLLRFRVTANPAPMHEWSPYAHVLPRHLHSYLVSKQGQFRLTPLGNNRTLLEGTTWYQHGLWPAEYWRLWSDAIIHRIHMRVLNHIRALAESENG